jgi:TPR repeat protein
MRPHAWPLAFAVACTPQPTQPTEQPDARDTPRAATDSTPNASPPSAAAEADPPAFALVLPARMSAPLQRLKERCDHGETPACLDAAAMFLDPRAGPDRPAVAARLLDSACKRGLAAACAELGWLHAQGLGVPHDAPRARALMERACRDGDARGCARLGEALVFARFLPEDMPAGMAALRQACERSDSHGCSVLARAIGDGIAHGIDARTAADVRRRALELGSQHCHDGHYGDCQDLLSVPGWGRSDRSRLSFLNAQCRAGGDCSLAIVDDASLERLCQQGQATACIGLAYRHGHPLDTPAAFEWLKTGCLMGSAQGCWALEHWVSRPERFEVLAQACREGELGACAGYARDKQGLSDEQVSGDASNPEQGLRREFACSHQSARHCRLVLLERERQMDRPAFVRAMERTCPLVRYRIEGRDMDAEGCRIAAQAYRSGDGVLRDAAHAAALFRRACFPESSPRYSGRALSACVSLAQMFDAGEGVSRDRAMATALFAGACYAGDPGACSVAAQRIRVGIGIAPNTNLADRIRAARPSTPQNEGVP